MRYIPDNIYVGFQERVDTFSGRLGYVTYKKGKVIYKNTSHSSWCKSELGFVETDNSPISGLILNKNVDRHYEVHRSSNIRVYAKSINCEFEISPTNLLFILANCDCVNSELSGEFVFGWNGPDLVLIPTNTQEYIENSNKSKFLDDINNKTLVPGGVYLNKSGHTLYYLGKANGKHMFLNSHYSNHINSWTSVKGQLTSFVGINSKIVESQDILSKYLPIQYNIRNGFDNIEIMTESVEGKGYYGSYITRYQYVIIDGVKYRKNNSYRVPDRPHPWHEQLEWLNITLFDCQTIGRESNQIEGKSHKYSDDAIEYLESFTK